VGVPDSIWIGDVRRQIGLDIDWRFFSLEEINRSDGQQHPWERDWSDGWGCCALLRSSAEPRWRTAIDAPVITPAPTGDVALALWLLVQATRRFPHLHEIKRPKTEADLVHIARQFQPYFDAREWESRERPAR
jgi:hypothetical protein